MDKEEDLKKFKQARKAVIDVLRKKGEKNKKVKSRRRKNKEQYIDKKVTEDDEQR